MWTAMMRKGGDNDSRLYFGGDKPRTRIEANRLACIFLSRIKLNSSTSKTCPKISNEKKPNSNPLPLNPASKIHHELRTSNPSAHLHLFSYKLSITPPFLPKCQPQICRTVPMPNCLEKCSSGPTPSSPWWRSWGNCG